MNTLCRAVALLALMTAVLALTADARGNWATFSWESDFAITPALPDANELIRFTERLDPPFSYTCAPGTLHITVDDDAWRVRMSWQPWEPQGAEGCGEMD